MGMYSVLSDCPYDCDNGYLFNPVTKEKQPCPHCKDALRQMVSGKRELSTGKSIAETLKIPSSYVNREFNFAEVILDSDSMTVESVMSMERLLSGMFSELALGNIPDSSYVLNLGSKCDFLMLSFKLLTSAMKGGLRVSPLMCVPYLIEMQLSGSQGYFTEKQKMKEKYGVTYEELRDLDLVVVALDSNTTDIGLSKVKGLMQYRAMVDKPTIVICNSIYNIGVLTLPQDSPRDTSFFLGKFVSIEYRSDLKSDATPMSHLSVSDNEPEDTPIDFKKDITLRELMGDDMVQDYL